MNDLYKNIETLCFERHVSIYRLCKDLCIRTSVISDLKTNRKKSLSIKTLSAIADYFHVSTDYLLGNVSDPFFYLDNSRILKEINSYENSETAPTSEGKRQEIPIDSVYFRIMQDAQKKGISPEDLKMAIEFIEKVRRHEQE